MQLNVDVVDTVARIVVGPELASGNILLNHT